jgi:urea carboxylase
MSAQAETAEARYSWGADEHLFVEVAEEMSLEAYFKAMAIVTTLREDMPKGVLDVCPANASYQVRFDPDVLAPDKLESHLREIESEVGDAHGFELNTRIVEIPVLYDDPWTRETLMRFRDRHQAPESTDLEYAAEINDLDGVDAFIEAHQAAPWLASMVGFVAGLPFLYQMVPRERQLEVPKYVRPRTDTPALTVGHGGCFGCIYSVRGAGGYQMFGITPLPIYDPEQSLPDFEDFVCFFRPGDIVKFTGIDRDRYDELREGAEAGDVQIRQRDVSFHPPEFTADPDAYNRRLEEVLHGD